MKSPTATAEISRPSEWHRALGRWFQEARRDLPWRRTRDPYAIWISEAMLQQTRVEVVVPFFLRFMARFPDVVTLARAQEAEVLVLWSGLGYYSRARALHRAARTLVARHGGTLPRTRSGWLELPGVGPYTAGAVLSIAFSASEPLVDGNVQRVFARLFALEDAQGSKGLGESCWSLARALVPQTGDALDPGDWNQALMELGARVCSVREPSCESCPLRPRCRAHAEGRVQQLPRPRTRRKPLDVLIEIFVVRSGGRLLLVHRPAGGRMAGLYELPTRELVDGDARPRLWPDVVPCAARAGEVSLGQLAHTITHHRIRADVRCARLAGGKHSWSSRWARPDELVGLPLTGLTRKAIELPAVRSLFRSAGPAP